MLQAHRLTVVLAYANPYRQLCPVCVINFLTYCSSVVSKTTTSTHRCAEKLYTVTSDQLKLLLACVSPYTISYPSV